MAYILEEKYRIPSHKIALLKKSADGSWEGHGLSAMLLGTLLEVYDSKTTKLLVFVVATAFGIFSVSQLSDVMAVFWPGSS